MASYLGRPARSRKARVTRLRGSVERPAEGTKNGVVSPKTRSQATGVKKGTGSVARKRTFGLHNPITMQQRLNLQQASKRPNTARRLLPAVVLLVACLVVTDPFVATATRVYDALVGDPYAMYRARLAQSQHKARLAQSQLQAANARIRSELLSLRAERTRQGSERESALASKIAELESLIESVTTLGIFPNHRTKPRNIREQARSTGKQERGELAAILESPQLAGSSIREHDTSSDNGVGGAEEPCLEHLDSDEGHIEDVNVEPDEAQNAVQVDTANVNDSEHERLMRRINRFISVLEILPLGAPVQGRLSSGFGHRRSPFSHRASFHYGVDIALRVGSKVMATGAGRVVKVTHTHTYGTMIDIQHAPGLISRYAHLSKVYVTVGQEVQRGGVIALSGNSGRSTGPHLHYEVRHNGKARNPTPFVQLAGRLSEFVDLQEAIS